MVAADATSLPVLEPNLQISFYYRLQQLKNLYLHDALKKTIVEIDLQALDDQLAHYVEPDHLKRIASLGLRGEVFFPVPCVIQANPFLLGYYRLLFGFSQKEFYNKGPFGRFKQLEDKGEIPDPARGQIPALCTSLVRTAEMLVDGIGDLSLPLAHELQLLTLGPQLRGGRNAQLGQDATEEVFELIKATVGSYAVDIGERAIRIENDSHRTVLIEFASDPDVRIVEQLSSTIRPLVSVEIKGGADRSNIHNRLGEAEKSHQKAKSRGFFEFWTILRSEVDLALAHRESPTTSHFFNLDRIKQAGTQEHRAFCELLGSLVGIRI